MKVNHLNLTVTDVPKTKELLERYFGLECLFEREDNFAAMTDDGGSAVTLMKGKEVSYPGTFHVGFMQESEERVDEINKRLKDDGFEVKDPARIHGAWSFYFQAPGGFPIEVLGSDEYQSAEDHRSAQSG